MTKRNQPCPCGSNIKFKKCCGNSQTNASPAASNTSQQLHAGEPSNNFGAQEHSKNHQNKPETAQDHYNLGCTYIERNMLEDAVACFHKALSMQPAAEVYYNLAVIQEKLGNLVDAIDSFQEALHLSPDLRIVHLPLGNLFLRTDNFQKAIDCYTVVLSNDQNNAEAYNNLGVALKKINQLEDAAGNFRKALKIRPVYDEAFVNLGVVLFEEGKPEEAIDCYRKALSINPQLSEAYINLGNAYKKLRQYEEAVDCFLKSLSLDPNSTTALNSLGLIYQNQWRYEAAAELFRKAISLDSEDYEAFKNLGLANLQQGRPKEATECFQKALSINPECGESIFGLGAIHIEEGNFKEASIALREAVTLNPDHTICHFKMTSLQKYSGVENHIGEMEKLFTKKGLEIEQRMCLAFGLAKVYEDSGEYERAFNYLQEGNRLKRETFSYSVEEMKTDFRQIKEVFNKSFIETNAKVGIPDNTPIFILGMPRSGTSLVEQILASHSRVYGAGELPYINQILFNTSKSDNWSEVLEHMGEKCETIAPILGNKYIKETRKFSTSAKHITDKMPGNFLLLGMIHLALPNAKIIHCKRNPMDNCLSIFKNLFSGALKFAYDLRELGHYYLLYKDLMHHWHNVLPPETIYDISYEDIVSNQESETRKLLRYCELPWEDNCLFFHKTSRIVTTASAVQVRKPIYKDSVQLWRKYEKQLGPLQMVLSGKS
ncbi:MAG: tetratricopeptide repeat protein [Thermodesulfobacteriota bacterium]